jgi:ankyrin repeat protein
MKVIILLLVLISCSSNEKIKKQSHNKSLLHKQAESRYDSLFNKIKSYLFEENEQAVINLIEKNKNILEKTDTFENDLLQISTDYDAKKMFKYLMSNYSFNYNRRNTFGQTALMMAIDNKNQEFALDLLLKKPNLNIKSSFGETALVLAVKKNLLDLVVVLLESKANPYDRGFMDHDLLDIAESQDMIELIKKYRKAYKINSLIKKK